MVTFVHWVIKIFSAHYMVNTVMERTLTTTAKLCLVMTAVDLSGKERTKKSSLFLSVKKNDAIFASPKDTT